MISSWEEFLQEEKEKDYFKKLETFWNEIYQNETVYPPKEKIFEAFKQCPLSEIKVILLGQDPYHEEGQAMGLSFSVPAGCKLPPSLKNLYKEMESDLGVFMNYDDGDLTYLARQGVLLLNVNLTVKAHEALSHQKKEYLEFTKEVFAFLNEIDRPMVFILLGGFAKGFAPLLTNPNHLILEANHPSPLSANRGGFFGTHLFSKCNDYLTKNGISKIEWGNAFLSFTE